MKILLLEPFFSGSHQQWAEGWQQHSRHAIKIVSLPGRHWKWRMFGGAVSLAKKVLQSNEPYDLILATDMLDLSTFLGLWHQAGRSKIPTVLYFHENQITYPWSPNDQIIERNAQYGFLNFTAAVSSDYIWFNSEFHQREFLRELPRFLGKYPDYQGLDELPGIQKKSSCQYLGLHLNALDFAKPEPSKGIPTLLWNHRWEYDKDPETFFQLCFDLKARAIPFQLIVLGQGYKNQPEIFDQAKAALKEEIIHWGFVKSRLEYAQLLWQADILPVTSRQDFFGGSAVEAIYCRNYPILPNRLAFPEHLPIDRLEECLFDTYEQLLEKTIQAINRIVQIRSDSSFREYVKKYDWTVLAEEYDLHIERLNA